MTIRVATAALSGRIFAGRPSKDGQSFKGERYDVTSDVLRAVADKIGIGYAVTVVCNGKPAFNIAVTKIESPKRMKKDQSNA